MNKNLKLLNLVTNVVKLTNLKRQCENKKEKHEKQDVQFTFFFLHMFEQICIENVWNVLKIFILYHKTLYNNTYNNDNIYVYIYITFIIKGKIVII